MKALRESEVFVWQEYTQEIRDRLCHPQNAGYFSFESLEDRILVTGNEGSLEEGNFITISILIDKEDLVVADVKYQAFGQTPLIIVAEKTCDILIRKNIYQAKNLHADTLEASLKTLLNKKTVPVSFYESINHILSAVDKALMKLPEHTTQVVELATPLEASRSGSKIAYPEFLSLPEDAKLKIVQDVIDQDIAPYIALDEGGAEVKEIKEGREVVLTYSGTCTSCYSAIGATLSAIEQTLKDKIHPDIIVTPDMESLNF